MRCRCRTRGRLPWFQGREGAFSPDRLLPSYRIGASSRWNCHLARTLRFRARPRVDPSLLLRLLRRPSGGRLQFPYLIRRRHPDLSSFRRRHQNRLLSLLQGLKISSLRQLGLLRSRRQWVGQPSLLQLPSHKGCVFFVSTFSCLLQEEGVASLPSRSIHHRSRILRIRNRILEEASFQGHAHLSGLYLLSEQQLPWDTLEGHTPGRSD
mmetsp:Transcript_38813/g.58997  ORF Transcript_38813/g.58997 Transcript_38813/m.58997 type:complete len:209 (-) Transcript_38813:833-1459(-)